MQKTWVWSLIREDSTCSREIKPVCLNNRAWCSGARALQQEKPLKWEDRASHPGLATNSSRDFGQGKISHNPNFYKATEFDSTISMVLYFCALIFFFICTKSSKLRWSSGPYEKIKKQSQLFTSKRIKLSFVVLWDFIHKFFLFFKWSSTEVCSPVVPDCASDHTNVMSSVSWGSLSLALKPMWAGMSPGSL